VALHSWMCHVLLSKGACCSQVLVIVVIDDVETDVKSCGLGWMLSTLLSIVFCRALYCMVSDYIHCCSDMKQDIFCTFLFQCSNLSDWVLSRFSQRFR